MVLRVWSLSGSVDAGEVNSWAHSSSTELSLISVTGILSEAHKPVISKTSKCY